MKHAPIIYIEDEEDYQMIVRRILGRAGLRIAVANTAQAGLEILRRSPPALLILDVNLPDADGYAVCARLRGDPLWLDLPILLLTVRRRPEEWLHGFSSGASDYLSKPIDPPELIRRVIDCMEGKMRPVAGDTHAEYQLVNAATMGNRAAYDVLVRRYKERLADNLRQIIRDETSVEDFVSEAFAVAYEKLGGFRGESSFYTWIYRIAINVWNNTHRNCCTVSMEELTGGDETCLPPRLAESDLLERTLAEEKSHMTTRAIEALSQVRQPYRKMLDLYFLRDMPYHAIAKKLKIPQGTVMSRLFKARQHFQRAWQEHCSAQAGPGQP